MAHQVVLKDPYFEVLYYPSTDQYRYLITKGKYKGTKSSQVFYSEMEAAAHATDKVLQGLNEEWGNPSKYKIVLDEGELAAEMTATGELVYGEDIMELLEEVGNTIQEYKKKGIIVELVKEYQDPDSHLKLMEYSDGTFKIKNSVTGELSEPYPNFISAKKAKKAEMAEYQAAKQLAADKVKAQELSTLEYTIFHDGAEGWKVRMSSTGEVLEAADLKSAETLGKSTLAKYRAPVDVVDKGTYEVISTADGKYAYRVKSTGVTKYGYGDKGAASSAGKAAVKKQSKAVLAEMGLDPGSDATEKLLGIYERRVSKVYAEAVEGMRSKQVVFMADYAKENAEMQARLASNQITKKQYKAWLQEQSVKKQYYDEMVETLAQDLVRADRAAMAMLNNHLPEVYATNFNFGTYMVESGSGIRTGFTLYDRSTVVKLVKDGNAPLLPAPKVDIPRDEQWNKRKLNSAVTQGVLQGETVPQIAARLQSVAQMDFNSAMRNARTMMTAAQNGGRVESYRRAKAMGIELKQRWLATLDGRTRDSHRLMDGEEAEVGEQFSNKCRFPGDPQGPAHEVYNCRCTLIASIDGQPYDMTGRASKLGDMTYEEWQEEARQHIADREARAAAARARAAQSRQASVPWQEYERRNEGQDLGHVRSLGTEAMGQLTRTDKDRINWYTGGSYRQINGVKRGVERMEDQLSSFPKKLGELESAMGKVRTTEDLYLNRGSGKSAFREIFTTIGEQMGTDRYAAEKMLEKDPSMLVDMTWRDKGFLSTTVKKSSQVDFEDDMLFHIYAPKGSNGAYVESVSQFKHEREFLFNSDHQFVIRNVEYHPERRYHNQWEVWVEAIVNDE